MQKYPKSNISQANVKLPKELKEWAQEQAIQDFQSLSGFVAKLINEERLRRGTVSTPQAAQAHTASNNMIA